MGAHMNARDLRSFASKLRGEILVTLSRGVSFRVEIHGSGLAFTPLSSGVTRPETLNRLQLVIDEFERSHSYRAGDYQDFSVNASYVLALLDLFLKRPRPPKA